MLHIFPVRGWMVSPEAGHTGHCRHSRAWEDPGGRIILGMPASSGPFSNRVSGMWTDLVCLLISSVFSCPHPLLKKYLTSPWPLARRERRLIRVAACFLAPTSPRRRRRSVLMLASSPQHLLSVPTPRHQTVLDLFFLTRNPAVLPLALAAWASCNHDLPGFLPPCLCLYYLLLSEAHLDSYSATTLVNLVVF